MADYRAENTSSGCIEIKGLVVDGFCGEERFVSLDGSTDVGFVSESVGPVVACASPLIRVVSKEVILVFMVVRPGSTSRDSHADKAAVRAVFFIIWFELLTGWLRPFGERA